MDKDNECPWPQGEGVFRLTLAQGEWMRHPASTKRPIIGPAEVEFIRHVDGGIDVVVTASMQT